MIYKIAIIVVTVTHTFAGANFVEKNAEEWQTCNGNVDDCLDMVTTFAPDSVTLQNMEVCRVLTIDNIGSLYRSGDAASRPCGPGTKNCFYQKLQIGLKNLRLNCTLGEGLPDLVKFIPGLKIPSPPPDIPSPIMRLWNANPRAYLPTSIIGHWTKFELKVEVMRDKKNDKYTVTKSELLSDHNALKIWCEGSTIFRTICESVSGFSKTKAIFGNIGQVFLRKLLPQLVKDKGKDITFCSCSESKT